MQVSAYSIGFNAFPENTTHIVAILEMAAGFGLAAGPALGSLMYNAFEFKGKFYILRVTGPFLLLGFITMALAPVVNLMIPASVDQFRASSSLAESDNEASDIVLDSSKVSYFQLLSDRASKVDPTKLLLESGIR